LNPASRIPSDIGKPSRTSGPRCARPPTGRKTTFCGGVDLILSDTTAVAPDMCFYDKPHGDWMIGGDFYAGPP